jgi:hypothetical protein
VRRRVMPQVDLVAGLADYPTILDNHAPDRVLSRGGVGFAGDSESPLHPVNIGIFLGHSQLRSRPLRKKRRTPSLAAIHDECAYPPVSEAPSASRLPRVARQVERPIEIA